MKILLFFFISSILLYKFRNINIYEKFLNSKKLQENDTAYEEEEHIIPSNDNVDDDEPEKEKTKNSTNIFPLLLGFDQYEYSNNLIQFFAYLRIIDFGKIDNISFPISIETDEKLRNLENEVIKITCTSGNDNVGDESIYIFNCSRSYNRTPLSLKFLNYEDFFINDIKINNLESTSYAKYLSSNIQEHAGENGNLNKAQLSFKNSTIINQINNIIIEGENDNNIVSNNAYLLYQQNETKYKNISCTITKKIGNNKIFNLICKPLFTFEGNLSFATVTLIDTNQNMYLDFNENYPFVNFTFKSEKIVILKGSSSGGLSEGAIVIIVFVCSCILGSIISAICKRDEFDD
jgi:hypothetical protein